MTTADLAAVFLADICANPADDVVRLIFADWLDENGEPERGEFVRLQCRIAALEASCLCGGCVRKRGGGQHTNGPCAVDQERDELPGGRSKQAFLRRRERELLDEHYRVWWPQGFEPHRGYSFKISPPKVTLITGDGHWACCEYRRGFVAAVTCTLAAWVGDGCGRCGGRGDWPGIAPHSRKNCDVCHGTGRVGGHGPALVRAAPLEEVRLTDREPLGPLSTGSGGELWTWHPTGGERRQELPEDLYAALDPPGPYWIGRPEAETALSKACLAWARQQPAP